MLYKKHLSDTLKLFRLSANLQGKVFYGNQGSEFSAHKMAVQVSYRFCSKIQKEDNIFATM